MTTDNKIIAVLAQLKEGVVGIYIQKKINQIEKEEVWGWDDFVKEVKIVFSNKNKTVNAKWKIKKFKQRKKHIVNFIIEFKILDINVIFLLKKNVRSDIIKSILEYLY